MSGKTSLALTSIAIASVAVSGLYLTNNANCLWALLLIPILFDRQIL